MRIKIKQIYFVRFECIRFLSEDDFVGLSLRLWEAVDRIPSERLAFRRRTEFSCRLRIHLRLSRLSELHDVCVMCVRYGNGISCSHLTRSLSGSNRYHRVHWKTNRVRCLISRLKLTPLTRNRPLMNPAVVVTSHQKSTHYFGMLLLESKHELEAKQIHFDIEWSPTHLFSIRNWII